MIICTYIYILHYINIYIYAMGILYTPSLDKHAMVTWLPRCWPSNAGAGCGQHLIASMFHMAMSKMGPTLTWKVWLGKNDDTPPDFGVSYVQTHITEVRIRLWNAIPMLLIFFAQLVWCNLQGSIAHWGSLGPWNVGQRDLCRGGQLSVTAWQGQSWIQNTVVTQKMTPDQHLWFYSHAEVFP